MATRDIVLIGASAGGVEALQEVVATLAPDFPAAVCVVLHLPAQYTSHLPAILSRAGALPATNAVDGEVISPGRIYVAPPDFHLLVGRGFLTIARGARVNRSRPAIDLMFQSAAIAYGPRAVGVILSGMLDDGTRGLAAVKRRGGYAIAQDPDEASFSGMPTNAIARVAVDKVLPVANIGSFLSELVREPLTGGESMVEENVPSATTALDENGDLQRDISPFTCPECGGTLWEMDEGKIIHYQCRVGHAFSPSNLLAAQVDKVESLLWSALRAMEEREAIYRQMLKRSRKTGMTPFATNIQRKIIANNHNAELLRQILLGEEDATVEPEEVEEVEEVG